MLLFTAPRDALLAPLQSVSGIVEKRHTLPILSNVLIEKKGDALTLLDASGAVTDEVEIPALDDDETYGRRTDGAAEWTVFGTSTRGASNAGGTVRE